LDALVASPTVINAFIDMLATDYRGAMRPLMTAVNTQWSEDEVRERMDRQIEHTPQDVMVERIRAWSEDDPLAAGWATASGSCSRPTRRAHGFPPPARSTTTSTGCCPRPTATRSRTASSRGPS
jgi:hypothetical protein